MHAEEIGLEDRAQGVGGQVFQRAGQAEGAVGEDRVERAAGAGGGLGEGGADRSKLSSPSASRRAQSAGSRQVAKTRQPRAAMPWAASWPIPEEHPVMRRDFFAMLASLLAPTLGR